MEGNKYKLFYHTGDGVYCFSSNIKYLSFLGVNDNYVSVRHLPKIKKIKITGNLIEQKFNSTSQLVFEVTEKCNFKCMYCGYGENYQQFSQDDNRIDMDWSTAKTILDYYINLWKNKGFWLKQKIYISFYGGEPLLNFKLIKDITNYIEANKPLWINVYYTLTTNGYLLDQNIDFFVKHNFLVSISMDGDENGNSFRITNNGEATYKKLSVILNNIKIAYSQYFNSNISFQSIINTRNSFLDICCFFKNKYNKKPKILEISKFRLINNNKIDVYYKNVWNDIESSYKSNKELYEEFNVEDPIMSSIKFFIQSFSNNFYNSYLDFINRNEKKRITVSSPTCIPFDLRVYISSRGLIFPCEKIGFEKPLGYIKNKKICLNFNKIAKFYTKIFNNYESNCVKCINQYTCNHCFYNDLYFYLDNKICEKYKPLEDLKMDDFLFLLKENKNLYMNFINKY